MTASQGHAWMGNVRPTLGTSDSFQNIPLSPLPKEDQSSSTSGVFPHVPLEHEIIASESAWDDSATPDEVNDQQSITSTKVSRQGSPAAAARSPSEYDLTAAGDQAQHSSETPEDQKQGVPSRASAVFNPHSDVAWTSGSSISTNTSAVTLVETLVALDTISRTSVAINKVSFSAGSPRDENWGPSISENDISDKPSKSSDYINRSTGPAELTISIPHAVILGQKTLSRAEIHEIPPASSIPEFFEVPIPVFPFPAGTSRCTHRNCPIKSRHEKGPYLHKGKLRTRKGSIFGASNPPPEIWFLYDMSRNGNPRVQGEKACAPVELFVKFHFSETRGEYVRGVDGAGTDVQEGRQHGRKSRFWRFWD
ncbi:MAG: hypothetical protein Q9161_004215 [Pseudevernia consocians]